MATSNKSNKSATITFEAAFALLKAGKKVALLSHVNEEGKVNNWIEQYSANKDKKWLVHVQPRQSTLNSFVPNADMLYAEWVEVTDDMISSEPKA